MPTRTLRRASAAAAFLLCSSAPAFPQGAVWRVAGDGSGDFEEIQPAVDAAADGDVILVAPGGYEPFKITGKGLRVHGPGASVVNVSGTLPVASMVVEGTAAHQTVVLDGLSTIAFAAGSPSTVHVAGCAGPVWLHNLFIDSFGAESLHVEASASVVLDRCVLQTNLSTPSALGEAQPEPGARIDGGARVFAYDSQFRGSHGPLVGSGIPAVVEPEDGGPGLLLVDAEAHLFGCALAGGSGNLLSVAGCLTGGDGGDGALLMTAGGTPPLLLVTGGTAQPGGGGFFDPGCAPPPAPGSAFDVQAGAVQHAGVTPRLAGVLEGAPVSGTQVHFAIEAAAGDLLLLFASGAAAPAFTLPLGASPFGLDLHLAPAPLVLVLASPLASPVSTLALTAPALPPGLPMAAPALQALFLDAQGGLHAGTPRALTVIAP